MTSFRVPILIITKNHSGRVVFIIGGGGGNEPASKEMSPTNLARLDRFFRLTANLDSQTINRTKHLRFKAL